METERDAVVVRCKSDESLATSDEYELVQDDNNTTSACRPRLETRASVADIERTLNEILLEAQQTPDDDKVDTPLDFDNTPASDSTMTDGTTGFCSLDNLDVVVDDEEAAVAPASTTTDECKLVGGSKFYNESNKKCEESATTPISPKEKQDHMKPTDSDEEVSDVDQECTVFSGVCYLGAAAISAPTSKLEIQRNMAMLGEQKESEMGIAVSVSIPTCSQGLVVLYDANTNGVMARYAVHQILFYARGAAGTAQAPCFAFTWSHGDPKESAIFQCHVFRCQIAEAVTQVSSCFAKAFERVPRSMTSSMTSESAMTGSLFSTSTIPETATTRQLVHVLECIMEIREGDSKGVFNPVPRERAGFKLRAGVDKQVVINVQQVPPNAQLGPETFQSTTSSQASLPGGGLIIERCFGVLLAPGRNVKHPDMQLLEMDPNAGVATTGSLSCSSSALWVASEAAFATLNVGSQDPPSIYITVAVDLVIRGLRDPIRLIIETPVRIFNVVTERFWFSKRPLIQQFFLNMKEITDVHGVQYEVISIETLGEPERSRSNFPSLSGWLPSPLSANPAPSSPNDDLSDGDEPLLSGTGEVSKECSELILDSWAQCLRNWGNERPKALSSLVKLGIPEALRGEVWQRLTNVDSNNALMDDYRILITKDCPCESVIQRDIARTYPANDHFQKVRGQDSLLRLAKAYAVYDSEVGYCQGLSFIAATLLLHMPEEQSFCVLVKLMYDYGLRDLYKDGFEVLTLRLYQLHRLMQEHVADLSAHFDSVGVEPHMFASQWFLTLFTARFPLPLVFHVVDVFLLQGTETLFQVALALLMKSKRDLLQLDFEGILKYFRVTLPKRCRAEDAPRHILKQACSIKIKRLSKYQQEFENLTKEVSQAEQMGNEMDCLREHNEQLVQEKSSLEKQLLETREALARETEKAISDSSRYTNIVQEYKDICSRLDRQLSLTKEVINGCNTCNSKLNLDDNKKSEVIVEGDIGYQTRIKELELELAQVKLAHVEALCKNQELTHQLNTAISEYQTALVNQKQTWPPWLSKTFGSIKEAAQNSRPSFQTYISSTFVSTMDGQQQANNQQPMKRQDSFPLSRQLCAADGHHLRRNCSNRHSMTADVPNYAKKRDAQKADDPKSEDIGTVMENPVPG